MTKLFSTKFLRSNLRLIFVSFVTVLSISLFLSLFEEVWEKSVYINNVDTAILAWFRERRTPQLTLFFIIVTQFASFIVALAFMSFAAFIFYINKYYRFLIALIISMSGASLFIVILKELVARPRPELGNLILNEWGFSFPSGHAFTAVALYGLLGFFLFSKVKNIIMKAIILFATILFILLISFSRIYLGVHWPSDVLASLIAGSGFLLVLMVLLRLDYEKSPKQFATPD